MGFQTVVSVSTQGLGRPSTTTNIRRFGSKISQVQTVSVFLFHPRSQPVFQPCPDPNDVAMDPCTILGAAGALANVIDVLGKTLRGINDLRCQWRDADLSVLTLECQLSALGTALVRIKQWTEASDGEIHHQLVMDLDSSVACCRLLVSKIDAEVSQFRYSNNMLHASSRFRLLLKTKDFEKVQVMIERQTGTLGLLLMACNTYVFRIWCRSCC